MIIGVDCDGVIVDFFNTICNWLQGWRGGSCRLNPALVDAWDIREGYLSASDAEVEGFLAGLARFDTCRHMKPLRQGIEMVGLLRNAGHEVLAVTDPWTPDWAQQRMRWLEQVAGFGLPEQIHCSRKDLLGLDLLIDDKPNRDRGRNKALVCLAQRYNECEVTNPRMTYQQIVEEYT